jgi:hypothetical protein
VGMGQVPEQGPGLPTGDCEQRVGKEAFSRGLWRGNARAGTGLGLFSLPYMFRVLATFPSVKRTVPGSSWS